MFHRKTVFVVGAGGSKEMRLPTGPELADILSTLLHFEFDFHEPSKGDRIFFYAMRNQFQDHNSLNDHLGAARQISESVRLTNSIDNYIDIHRHDPRIATVGKAAITYTILKSEASSILRPDPATSNYKFDLGVLNDTWLLHFCRALTNNVPLEAIDSVFNNVAIVTFNYDRCIERFLTLWLERVYNIQQDRARRLVKTLSIVRPYGTVGDLEAIPFGFQSALQTVFKHSGGIKTYSEQVQDEEITNSIEQTMTSAETLVFLGTAFHPQNMRILRSSKTWRTERILASATGFSHSDTEDIKIELRKLVYPRAAGVDVKIDVDRECTCAKIFSTYSRAFQSAP
jgi:hypothetical protein